VFSFPSQRQQLAGRGAGGGRKKPLCNTQHFWNVSKSTITFLQDFGD